MADRGRDLKFSILSDVGRFDTDKPARGLEDLADAAEAAGKFVDRLDDVTGRSTRGVDDLGDKATTTARSVDSAFDKIARSSNTNLDRKLESDARSAKESLGEVRDEANDTAREMAASFDGTSESLVDAFQELGANAGQAFGPVGIAAGAAAAIGVGLIRAQQQKLKDLTNELVQDMLDAGGKLNDAAINDRVTRMATEDAANFMKYDQAAQRLGVSLRDVARARAGDGEAAKRVIDRLDALDAKQREEAKSAGDVVAQRVNSTAALNGLRAELGLTAQATDLARRATETATSATNRSTDALGKAGDQAAILRKQLAQPITVKVGVAGANVPYELRRIWAEADDYFRRNPITIRTKGPTGQRPIRDVP